LIGLRKIYGYSVIGLFGIGIIAAAVFYAQQIRSELAKDDKDIDLEISTRFSMKKMQKLEKRRLREEKEKQKQRRKAIQHQRKQLLKRPHKISLPSNDDNSDDDHDQ